MSELSYRQVGDFLFPNINLPQQGMRPLNKYGWMRKRFLKEHQPLIFQTMLLNGTLTSHLQETSITADRRPELLLKKMAKEANVTEEFKAADPTGRAGLCMICSGGMAVTQIQTNRQKQRWRPRTCGSPPFQISDHYL